MVTENIHTHDNGSVIKKLNSKEFLRESKNKVNWNSQGGGGPNNPCMGGDWIVFGTTQCLQYSH